MFTGVGGGCYAGWWVVGGGTNDATTWWQMIRHVGHALFHSQYFISDIFLILNPSQVLL